ncbi:MAG TPA: hypothetical protein DCX25_02645 [Candidatus Pacebacteria bacterium]|nr:MAG: hypothetical protein UX00_C0004G0048 [Microgenomates group bacterium GW2011_GWB1_45_17]KKU23954.1 MAG: hypothetical protein UX35_C0003G0090 [Microgenomates group bacterium GW2011_GWA1_46_15]KKU24653.1 MAG: hypothetical protein UX36_C0001G0270 [Microgenomates group bacterium GW2011_GWC1_46_15]HAV15203.1 hypothetical protein [Candidatus Paceibacterota bacterium]HCR11087.1 hypothetical protein [Candidatus Paceibacterota bacterium]
MAWIGETLRRGRNKAIKALTQAGETRDQRILQENTLQREIDGIKRRVDEILFPLFQELKDHGYPFSVESGEASVIWRNSDLGVIRVCIKLPDLRTQPSLEVFSYPSTVLCANIDYGEGQKTLGLSEQHRGNLALGNVLQHVQEFLKSWLAQKGAYLQYLEGRSQG